MAFNKQPNTWLTSWSENGSSINVPIATFPELTAAEADGTTGDIRKIVWAIMQKLWAEWNDDREAVDRPTQWTCKKSVTVNANTGVVTTTFTHKFYTAVSTQEVVDEP